MKKILGIIFLSLLLSGAAYAKKIYDSNENGILIKECVFSWSKCYRMAAEHCAQHKKFYVHVWNHQTERPGTVRLYCVTEVGQFFYEPLLKKQLEVQKTNFDPNSSWASKSNTGSTQSSGSSTNDKIAQSKQICRDLGFKVKTEKFADCALKMMSIQFEATNKVASSSGGTTQEIIVKHKNDYDVWDAMLDVSNALLSNGNNSSSSSSNNNTRCVIGRTNPTFGTTTMNCR